MFLFILFPKLMVDTTGQVANNAGTNTNIPVQPNINPTNTQVQAGANPFDVISTNAGTVPPINTSVNNSTTESPIDKIINGIIKFIAKLTGQGDPLAKPQATQAPVAQVPVAQAPVAQAPVAQAPVAQAPVAQAPVAQAPVEQAPVAQAPVAQAPVEQAPVAQAPVEQTPLEQTQSEEPVKEVDTSTNTENKQAELSSPSGDQNTGTFNPNA